EAHLGAKAVAKLTRRTLQQWVNDLVEAPPRVRTPKDAPPKHLSAIAPSPDYQRRRRATVTRIWASLKAALNHAHVNDHAPITDAWAGYTPFTGTDAARVRWLTDDEARRLVDVCAPDFRALVTTAILTGIRYGDLTRLTAGDYDANSATLLV